MISKRLQEAANVLRADVLKMTTAAGSGHPTSCLSAAEIMACLFFYEMKYDIKSPNNPDNDEFVLSKGHAAPALYSALYRAGCINHNLLSLRKFTSKLEGHPMPSSLKWVKVATGSLGQGLSVGLGMALAARLQKREFHTYVLLGDSELTEGSIYEALQLASYYKLNNLTAIADINKLGQTGETIEGHNINNYKKRFEGFGWQVITINGHDINQILRALKNSKKTKKPTLILAKTLKGKGVSFIEDKNGWHGKALSKEKLEKALKEIPETDFPEFKIIKPKKTNHKFKIKSFKKNNYHKNRDIATREAYGRALANLAKSDPRILAVDAETGNSTFSNLVKEKTPNQFIQTFIAEQNMIGVSTGLSIKGFRTFPSTFAAFLTRAFDQLRMASISRVNLTICGSHAGVSIGEDGASQMGLEDIAMFRSLRNSNIFYPSDAISCDRLTNTCSRLKGINYIRTTRAKTPIIYNNNEKFKIGEFKILKKSNKDQITLIGSGITLHESLKAHEKLKKKNINSAVIDLYCIKPFNHKKLIDFTKKHGNKIIITEDHHYEGGIGEMLKSGLIDSGIQIKHLAVNRLPHSGTTEELLGFEEIDEYSIIRNAIKLTRK
ncbi:transketolase [Candidatus Pacearchaeota archaeon]|nr:transketolase [Candidatus Pacearchaeota archaeon]